MTIRPAAVCFSPQRLSASAAWTQFSTFSENPEILVHGPYPTALSVVATLISILGPVRFDPPNGWFADPILLGNR